MPLLSSTSTISTALRSISTCGNNLSTQVQRCSPSYSIRVAFLRHVQIFRPTKAVIRTQTRYITAFSSTKQDIPLSPAQKVTIYALSTPPGRAGIAVIRISGPQVPQIYHEIVRPTTRSTLKGTKNGQAMPEPWKMHRCSVVDPETKHTLDEGLAVYFAAPKSFTVEDVLELHIHSGRAIISAILFALSKLPACRMAEPGEFTRRAFEKGRLDLTQVEGLKDLIDAETEEQRKWALSAAHGRVRDEVEALRNEVIACLVLCEAEIDFGDTEEIDEGLIQKAKQRALALIDKLRIHLQDSRRGEIMRTGIRIVIFGEPNAGKSSLLNWLARREAAIVTPLPGTTRDILEVSLDLGGLPVIVCDTAGLRTTIDPVERIGVAKAGDAVRQADIALCVISVKELERRHRSIRGPHKGNSPVEGGVWGTEMEPLVTQQTLILLNKVDLAKESASRHAKIMEEAVGESLARHEDVGIEWWWRASLATGEGMQAFVDGLVNAIKQRYGLRPGERANGGLEGRSEPMIRHGRQRMHMENAMGYLEAFVQCADDDVVLGAEELRYAAKEIGAISRAVSVDDVLDAVFRDFCIGK